MKPQLSYDKQADLLARRGLTIDDRKECMDFLSTVSYYRLSGYFRYWQRDPAKGDNRFHRGSSFKVIRDLYVAEQHLKALCERVLWPVEILLRTRFAHSYAERFGAYGAFNIGEGFTRPLEERGKRVEEYALRDLDRSKEAFVAHYRENFTAGDPTARDPYDQMPIWAAVEAFSFGTLSRLIEASSAVGGAGRRGRWHENFTHCPSQPSSILRLLKKPDCASCPTVGSFRPGCAKDNAQHFQKGKEGISIFR